MRSWSSCHSELVSESCNSGFREIPQQVQDGKVVNSLPSCPPAFRASAKRAAFNLAEVLITLAIIGVVAAVTIPTLVRNYQEKVTVTKVKKMYSTLAQAYKFYLAENDKAEYIYAEDEGSAEKVFKIFEPYLKISEDCTKNGTKNCFYSGEYLLKNGDSWIPDCYALDGLYMVRLNDGSALMFRASDELPETEPKGYYFQAFYDINGAQPPNTVGVDVFTFLFDSTGTIPNYNTGIYGINRSCLSSKGDGRQCAGWVVVVGNMDYLHCDDLKWESKHSCNE